MNSEPRTAIEVDLHRLERRFASARVMDPQGIRRLAQSLQAYGQRRPVIAVNSSDALVLVDGYRRVEALVQLGRDTALAELWEGSVAEGLLQVMGQRQARPFQAVEEAWLIASLVDEGLSQEAVAKGLGKDKSWVSRRLALITDLPEAFQQAVRKGEISTWTANRILLPLARANESDAAALLDAIRKEPISTRSLSVWFEHYQKANRVQRERLVRQPHLFLKALNEEQDHKRDKRLQEGPEGQWLADVQGLERLLGRLLRTLPKVFDPPDPQSVATLRAAFDKAARRFEHLRRQLEQTDAVPREKTSPPRPAPGGDSPTGDQSLAEDLAQHRARGTAGKRHAAKRADPEVAARHLGAARAVLGSAGQCGAHPGVGA